MRGVLRDLFTNSGYTVIEAVDGAAGVASAKSDRPDIILMDCTLRRSGGTAQITSTSVSDTFATFNVSVTETPLPALPLFAGGLGALGLLGWRWKRKAAAAA